MGFPGLDPRWGGGVGRCSTTHHVFIVSILYPGCKAREAWNWPLSEFIYLCFPIDVATGSNYIVLSGMMTVSSELESLSWPLFRYHPRICLEILKKTKKNLQSEYSMTRPRFKPGNSWIQARNVAVRANLFDRWTLKCVEPIPPLPFHGVMWKSPYSFVLDSGQAQKDFQKSRKKLGGDAGACSV